MNLAKRIIAGVGAPALLAGVMLVGSAAAKPRAVAVAPLSDTVTFTAQVIVGGSHFTVNSLSCRLKDAGVVGTIPCRIGGAGALDGNGNPSTADVSIVSLDGPIALHLTNVFGCGFGTGVEINPGGPAPVTGEVMITSAAQTGPNTFIVTGTAKVYDGTRVVCSD